MSLQDQVAGMAVQAVAQQVNPPVPVSEDDLDRQYAQAMAARRPLLKERNPTIGWAIFAVFAVFGFMGGRRDGKRKPKR